MKLDTLYSLRKNFTIIGLTGRIGSGCSEIAKKLSDKDFIKNIDISDWSLNMDNPEDIKSKICYDFLRFPGNFSAYEVIEYKSVILLHLLHESIVTVGSSASIDDVIKGVINVIGQNGKNGEFGHIFTNRFDACDDFEELKKFLIKDSRWHEYLKAIADSDLNNYLKRKRSKRLYVLYFGLFKPFSDKFFNILFQQDATKRSRLLHDLGNNLRCYGTVLNQGTENIDTKHIYTVADTINSIIKLWKRYNPNAGRTKIVIDSLKNSLELMFFKEKYSAFYMLSTNMEEENRISSLSVKTSLDTENLHFKEILKLDEAEYSGSSFTKGEFGYPDIENCIQKSEYHLSLDSTVFNLDRQIIRLLALIQQPGIVTPSAVERCMQIAFNAKLNSGCISRQVGAVVTDSNFSVKAIGWNDVPEKQLPCNLRNLKDLIEEDVVKNPNHFSDYEKEGVVKINKDKSVPFKELAKNGFSSIPNENLEGRNCSFCFKSHQNSYEYEKNQVHTRSLHAEENAMMQIVKYGGEPLLGGNLFTTASPCELCSKKAFQLGVRNIYYIDPYPGIATKHILKNGLDQNDNPELRQFYGAVGRTFQKLYDPFMAYKDELFLLTGISPKTPDELKSKKVGDVLLSKVKDNTVKSQIQQILEGDDSLDVIADLISKGLKNS